MHPLTYLREIWAEVPAQSILGLLNNNISKEVICFLLLRLKNQSISLVYQLRILDLITKIQMMQTICVTGSNTASLGAGQTYRPSGPFSLCESSVHHPREMSKSITQRSLTTTSLSVKKEWSKWGHLRELSLDAPGRWPTVPYRLSFPDSLPVTPFLYHCHSFSLTLLSVLHC